MAKTMPPITAIPPRTIPAVAPPLTSEFPPEEVLLLLLVELLLLLLLLLLEPPDLLLWRILPTKGFFDGIPEQKWERLIERFGFSLEIFSRTVSESPLLKILIEGFEISLLALLVFAGFEKVRKDMLEGPVFLKLERHSKQVILTTPKETFFISVATVLQAPHEILSEDLQWKTS